MIRAGAFGLRFTGIPPTRWLAVEGGEQWPVVRVESSEEVVADRPLLEVEAGRIVVPAGADLDQFVHPLLGHVGLAHATASGWDAVHAGAVLDPAGRAWAVIGEGTAGKSTLLAALAAGGTPVLTDDVLVLDGHRVLAGPRCIDLRQPPPADHAVTVRGDTRWRVTQDPCPAEGTLAGLVFLAWGEGAPRVETVAATDVVRQLLARQAQDGYPQRPETALSLAVLPARRLVRGKDMDRLGETARLIRGLWEPGD